VGQDLIYVFCEKVILLGRVTVANWQCLEDFCEQPKILPKTPGNAFFDVLLMSPFQNFAAKKKTALRAVF